ncbi:ATP-binding protein [Blautia sp. NSJ-175]|jgi:DNA replication protein DnaC|uniref:ATP-binding protein n=1 Tax=Blautia sp. NSJ-175 TaxID=2931396 RepID=UPI001FD60669|nr:ATP-binding protein [Blautia sp. NSJ-175]MCJ7849054.1 ATP-binding protein [Blautia sp. NSJ-175]
MDLTGVLPISESGAERLAEGDHIGEDGLVYCGKCGSRKQLRVKFGDKTHVVRCVCKCESKELEEKKRQEEYEEQMRRINRLKEASMMDKKYREVTFDKYEVREENKKVFEMAKKYADRFQNMYKKNQGLLLYGPVGTGKSFTAACIGNYLLDNAKPVIMTSFVKILQDIWENDREAEYITILNSASLLIVDDLGTERETDYALEKVYNIIDSRVRANKPMIITSNLELNDMMECEDIRKKRIYDRILECCYPMYVGGKSFRMMKAAQRFDEMKDFLEE